MGSPFGFVVIVFRIHQTVSDKIFYQDLCKHPFQNISMCLLVCNLYNKNSFYCLKMFCKSLGPVYPEGSGVPGEKSTTPVHPSLVTESVFTRSEVEIVSV